VILSIDCGSTNHKVALYNERLQRLAVCTRPVTYTVRNAKRAEFEAEKIWQDTVALIHQVCAMATVAPIQIKTITLAGQAQTFTILNNAGRPIMPFISWMDKRAEAESVELTRWLGNGFHRHCSFSAPAPQLQLSKLLWLARNHPARLKKAVVVVSLPGFLSFRLAGINGVDNNLAAMSGLYSMALGDWWPAALKAVGLRRGQLGNLVKIGAAVPAQSACRELTFSPQLRIVFAGNDQTAGAYANAVRSVSLVLTLGTALVVYRYAGKTPGHYHGDCCWGPYPGGGYYELTTRDEGCAAFDWAIGQLMPGNEAGFMNQAESASAGAAYFYPQRMRTKSAWIGSNNRAGRARAVLEGVCFSARQLMEDDLKIRPASAPIIVIGGGSQSGFWLQILANVLNCPVCRGEGDILLGAAMMARPGITPPIRQSETVVMPDRRAVEDYGRIYRAWRTQISFSSCLNKMTDKRKEGHKC